MKMNTAIIATLFAFGTLTGAALANGSLCGTVKSHGQPLAGATVSVDSPSQQLAVTTNARGLYCLAGLHANAHVVRVQKAGYVTMISNGFLPVGDHTLRLDFITQPGSGTQTRTPRKDTHVNPDVTSDVYVVH